MSHRLEVADEVLTLASHHLDEALQTGDPIQISHPARAFIMATMIAADADPQAWLAFARERYELATGREFPIGSITPKKYRHLERQTFGACQTKIPYHQELEIVASAVQQDGRVVFKD